MSYSKLSVSAGTGLFFTAEAIQEVLDYLKKVGVREIDTAVVYGSNETLLGDAGAGTDPEFAVSTKNPSSGVPGSLANAEVIKRIFQESIDKLKTKQVDIYYLHSWDDSAPISQWMPALNDIHSAGGFLRLGISNFTAAQTRELYDYNKSNGYVLPMVFQGNYNALARQIEGDLFPTLRELEIAFYAYSPMAGGFLNLTRQQVESRQNDSMRFGSQSSPLADLYSAYYARPEVLGFLDRWTTIAEEAGVTRAELAYRWMYHNSALRPEQGDKIIVGASRVGQFESSLANLSKGPLREETVRAIDTAWKELVDSGAKLFVNNFDVIKEQKQDVGAVEGSS